MSAYLFSASEGDRVAVCAPSTALPKIQYSRAEWADRGTAIHAFLAAVPNIGRDEALKLVPEKWREDCELLDLSEETGLGRFLDSTKYLAEVTFAFDVLTGKARVLGQNLGRDYSAATANEVVGTVDLVGLTADAVVVPDYKSGHAYLDPLQMWQLKIISLIAARAYDRPRAVSGALLLRDDGTHYFKRVEFDELDLDLFEISLRQMAARVVEARATHERGERLQTVEGEHCKYCPAFDYCPSKMALVKAFAAAPDGVGITIEGATEEELALAWERATALEQVVERVKGALKLRARQRPIPMGKGQVLGESSVEEGVKPDVASAVLAAKYGLEAAKASVETKPVINKATIEKALRKYVLPQHALGITALKEEAYGAIREAKGYSIRVDVKKRKPTASELAPAEEPAAPLPEGEAQPEQGAA